mgnify:CR=1 FL=1
MTHHYTQHYIDGRWQTAHDDKVFDVHDASTEEVMATVPQGTAEEAAQETVDGQTGATMTDFAIAADGSVTVDVRMDPNTIVAERLDFLLGDLVVVTAEATAPPPTA